MLYLQKLGMLVLDINNLIVPIFIVMLIRVCKGNKKDFIYGPHRRTDAVIGLIGSILLMLKLWFLHGLFILSIAGWLLIIVSLIRIIMFNRTDAGRSLMKDYSWNRMVIYSLSSLWFLILCIFLVWGYITSYKSETRWSKLSEEEKEEVRWGAELYEEIQKYESMHKNNK